MSHAIIALAIVLLFAELVLAASSFGVATDVSHALCGLAWGGCLVLFTALPDFRTPTFALTLLCLSVDLFAGIWITIRLASKHLSVDQTLL